MGPVPVVQEPEHGKARRTAQVIGADRVLPATAAPSSMQGEVRASNSMEPTRPARCLALRDTSLGWPGGSSRGRQVPVNAPAVTDQSLVST